MAGEIWLESQPGAGSTFHFHVVLRRGARPHPRHLPDLHDLKVLIVDDNATNRRILQDMLGGWGVSVEAVASGAEALQRLKHIAREKVRRPLIISDVNMPRMDGFMLSQRLREDEDLQDVKVILLTSGGRQGDLKRCEELGVCCHLMKPVKSSELLEAITRASGEPPPGDAEPAAPAQTLPHVPPLRILLAEDGKANRVVALGLLRKAGHSVEVALNGQEAIA